MSTLLVQVCTVWYLQEAQRKWRFFNSGIKTPVCVSFMCIRFVMSSFGVQRLLTNQMAF